MPLRGFAASGEKRQGESLSLDKKTRFFFAKFDFDISYMYGIFLRVLAVERMDYFAKKKYPFKDRDIASEVQKDKETEQNIEGKWKKKTF